MRATRLTGRARPLHHPAAPATSAARGFFSAGRGVEGGRAAAAAATTAAAGGGRRRWRIQDGAHPNNKNVPSVYYHNHRQHLLSRRSRRSRKVRVPSFSYLTKTTSESQAQTFTAVSCCFSTQSPTVGGDPPSSTSLRFLVRLPAAIMTAIMTPGLRIRWPPLPPLPLPPHPPPQESSTAFAPSSPTRHPSAP